MSNIQHLTSPHRMGSLPNLNELDRIRRKLEHERNIAKKEQRAREQRESSRERDKLPPISTLPTALLHPPHSQQGPHNPQIISTVATSAAAAAATAATAAVGGGTPGQVPKHYHHRHSLTTRRVLRTRSSGGSYNIWDDPMIEHMTAYSPISSRSHRINVVSPYQVQAALAASTTRRRDSINSSIGANSIRRLLTLNNRNCRHKIPSHVKAKICKNFTFLTVAHGLICAILMPLIGLQGSNSIWHHREQWVHVGPNIGSMLLSISFLISSGMCFLTTRLIAKVGYTILIASSYIGMCLFLSCHLYPSIYTLIPAYVILGITLGPAWVGKIALVVFFACKLSCGQHECNLSFGGGGGGAAVDSLDEHKIFCNRDQKVRRLGRWFFAAQDLGIILGAVIALLVLACSSNDSNCFLLEIQDNLAISKDSFINRNITDIDLPITTPISSSSSSSMSLRQRSNLYVFPNYVTPTNSYYSDDMYNRNEQGERICGADLCPVWKIAEEQAINGTLHANFIHENGQHGRLALIIVYLMFAIISLTLACLSRRIDITFRSEQVKGMTDTLMFAGPMAYFIGTEQAYMLGDFTKAFVSCSLGLQMVAGALIGMGIMQSIVSCTLSMLLRHTKRIAVIAAGFFFHACLLLVLSRWKPSKDDSALFYVIAASWGACNAMWETLLFALVTLTHTSHVAEVIAPLQALRFLALGVTFAAHGFLCENPKILILVIILVLSVPPYAMLEIRLESQRKTQMISL